MEYMDVWQQASGLDRSKSSKHTKVKLYSFSLVTYLLTVHLICTNSVVFFCKGLIKPSSSIVSGRHWSGPSTSSTKMRCDDEWTLYLEWVCVAGRTRWKQQDPQLVEGFCLPAVQPPHQWTGAPQLWGLSVSLYRSDCHNFPRAEGKHTYA